MNIEELVQETGGASELAKRVGVTRTAVHQWRAGISLPSTRHLIELHRISKGRLDLESLNA